ncbi:MULTISPECIES: hypothetical protein [Leifsonia]|jgi:hypothetical protein|uniref:YtxH domain-containing protein n=3 Tax=Leifsonia TaxID=110932 RepID=U2RBH8_LEIAQ|nr:MULTISPECIES: hypothetical protein [Leifsonia]ERK72600.1 hypothetical protein N136_01038 [Leifsonia aquatica ATCC 14665]MBB2967663.1 hypothetical protein [Leifsonia aquatica]NYK09909.1 hypothetical protein [Leifsonia naganoensis]
MRFKTFLVLIGIAVAYVLGARAGRERYQQIVGAVSSFWNDPNVKKTRKKIKKATR